MKQTFLLLFSILSITFLKAQPEGIELDEFASGFTKPVAISNMGDDRLFIVQQNGIIKILNLDGESQTVPFLNIIDRVGDNASERGLLGLAFHPDYETNGYFYVNYTNLDGNTRVSRFSVDPDDPNSALPDSELILLSVNQLFSNHNGGDLQFGPDGYLYVALGDGGFFNDPQNQGQMTTTFLGKLLRLDVDNPAGGENYGIPADNPFADPNDGVLDEIWALGLRNPWRISFDRLTNDLWIADVGQDQWEEINFQEAGSAGGQNYGWRCYEASNSFITSGCGDISEYVFPVHEYQHNSTNGCSITGGFVYRGCRFPALYGYYVYADYCSGQFWALGPDGSGGWTNVAMGNYSNLQYSTFGEDKNGELYVAAHAEGKIYRVEETSLEFDVAVEVTDETCEGVGNGQIELNWNMTNDPVSLEWNDGSDSPLLENLTPGSYSFVLAGGNGCTIQQTLEVGTGELAAPIINVNGADLSVDDNYASYQWFLDGAPITDANGPDLEADVSGEYSLEVVDENGCTASSDPVTVMINQLITIRAVQSVILSPNPFRDQLGVQLQANEEVEVRFEIRDLNGRVLLEQNQRGASIELLFQLGELPAGSYLLHLSTQEGEMALPVVKI
jgi:glucose/arabinose dehydrogenase